MSMGDPADWQPATTTATTDDACILPSTTPASPQQQHAQSTTRPKTKKKKAAAAANAYKKAPNAPRRFKSPYILFSIAQMKGYKEKRKGNSNITTLSARISQDWKALSDQERQVWIDAAQQDKLRYEAEKASYQGPWQVQRSKAKKAKKDPQAPKRPPSAFLLYCQVARPGVRQTHPHMPLAQVSKHLGAQWKTLSEKDRQVYVMQEQAARLEYKKAKDEWTRKKQKDDAKKTAPPPNPVTSSPQRDPYQMTIPGMPLSVPPQAIPNMAVFPYPSSLYANPTFAAPTPAAASMLAMPASFAIPNPSSQPLTLPWPTITPWNPSMPQHTIPPPPLPAVDPPHHQDSMARSQIPVDEDAKRRKVSLGTRSAASNGEPLPWPMDDEDDDGVPWNLLLAQSNEDRPEREDGGLLFEDDEEHVPSSETFLWTDSSSGQPLL